MGSQITGGVDTHLDVHVAAALDEHGGLLGTASFATTSDGYGELAGWLCSFGEVVLVGVEGTGSYGAGLTRFLHAAGVAVVEVDRPNRQRRRRSGKSDTHDAVSAARAAFAGDALGAPKTRDGNVEAIRVLRLARSSASRDRTRALNQMRSLITTAPDELRTQLRGLTIPHLLRTAAGFRPAGRTDVASANRLALKTLARRVVELADEIAMLDDLLTPLVAETAPRMIERLGVGTDTAGALLVAAGENSSRIRNERSFARLCGAAPLDASSGKQQRFIASADPVTAKPTVPSGGSSSRDSPTTPGPAATSNDAAPKAKPKPKPSAASSATSHASSTHASQPKRLLDNT